MCLGPKIATRWSNSTQPCTYILPNWIQLWWQDVNLGGQPSDFSIPQIASHLKGLPERRVCWTLWHNLWTNRGDWKILHSSCLQHYRRHLYSNRQTTSLAIISSSDAAKKINTPYTKPTLCQQFRPALLILRQSDSSFLSMIMIFSTSSSLHIFQLHYPHPPISYSTPPTRQGTSAVFPTSQGMGTTW